jgi:L-aminopeptidase/D-esterase-like protein
MAGVAHLMKSGLGNSSVKTPGGYGVGAIVSVNALGDIYDPATGGIVAGAFDRKAKEFLAEAKRGPGPGGRTGPRLGESTTIGVVATDCDLSKVECERVALMAMGGLAQAIRPSFTPFDGDTLFVLSTRQRSGGSGPQPPSAWTARGFRAQLVAEIGIAAQEAVVRAILDAVRSASGIPGIPAAKDVR